MTTGAMQQQATPQAEAVPSGAAGAVPSSDAAATVPAPANVPAAPAPATTAPAAETPPGLPPGFQMADLTRYLVATGVIPAQPTEAERAAEARAQRMLVLAIIVAVFIVHLPWLAYLVAVHGCWGGFLDACLAPSGDEGGTMLFAQVAFAILRVQSVLSVDVAKFSELMQLSTGIGAFVLARIAAANGQIVQAGKRRFVLAAFCAVCFVMLFWAELHLTGKTEWPILGNLTVLDYIDFETPMDIPPGNVGPGLLRYLQVLRLADALIFGAALALLKPPKAKK